MADRPNRRSRRIKKPLSEIEAATEAIRQRSLVSIQDHIRVIMTIGSLSQGEREVLFNSASKAFGAVGELFVWPVLLFREKHKRKNADTARTGNSAKLMRWHSKAKEFRDALWRKRPDFWGNADKSSQEIHSDLTAFCQKLGVAAPKPGTVAKYLSSIEGSKD